MSDKKTRTQAAFPEGLERRGGPSGNGQHPDPEVLSKATRRRFSAEYKLRILNEAEACRGAGEIGSLLRREGLYSSHLTVWRKARQEGSLSSLSRSRGPQGQRKDPVVQENARLKKEVSRLQRRLHQAEAILEIQKKASELLGIPLSHPDIEDSE